MNEPDPAFAEPRLAAIYDALDGDRDDLDLYVELIESIGAQRVLDVGCGTGTLACRLALAGYDVVGADPAVASLDVARGKIGAERVAWEPGEVASFEPVNADVASMTGNVAQVFLDDADWVATLAGVRTHLAPGGRLLFETRDPGARAWERWNRSESFTRTDVPDAGVVESWADITAVELPFITFRWTYRFLADGAVLTSDSTLRFRERDEVTASLNAAGFEVVDVLDAPDRPLQEMVFLAVAS